MKFLAAIHTFLDRLESRDLRIEARIESYSCKLAGTDKAMSKLIEEEIVSSPPSKLSVSPFGPLTESASRKTLVNLILLLNTAFPDYDFRSVEPTHFQKETYFSMVQNYVNTTLEEILSNADTIIGDYEVEKLWASIDENIDLRDCEIYSFVPDPDVDPFLEEELSSLWSFNYFFYNRKLKRVVFFHVLCTSKSFLEDEEDEIPDLERDELEGFYRDLPDEDQFLFEEPTAGSYFDSSSSKDAAVAEEGS